MMLVHHILRNVVPNNIRLFSIKLFEIHELSSTLPPHNIVSELPRELYVYRSREIRYLGSEHVRWNHVRVNLVAVFASVPRGLILHLFAAIRARIVHHFVVCEDPLNEPGDLVELGLRLRSCSCSIRP